MHPFEAVDGHSPRYDYRALKTLAFTPLEPALKKNKYYIRGVGKVLTVDLDTSARVLVRQALAPASVYRPQQSKIRGQRRAHTGIPGRGHSLPLKCRDF